MDHYITDRLELYGLVTARGEIVTAPVYANIYHANGFLFLKRGSDALYEKEDPMQERGDFDLTVAAPDGRWVREVKDRYVAAVHSDDGGLLALGMENGGLEFLNGAGETIAVFPGEVFEPYLGAHSSFTWSDEGGPWVIWYHDGVAYLESYNYLGTHNESSVRLYLDLATGEILEQPPAGYPTEPEYRDWVGYPEFDGYEIRWSMIDNITGNEYYVGYHDDNSSDLLDQDGNVLFSDCEDMQAITDGMLSVWLGQWWQEDSAKPSQYCWYDLSTGNCVFRYPIRENSD